ncbi:MAG: biopolymer transporter ExbD [Pseudomonadota bacterium]
MASLHHAQDDDGPLATINIVPFVDIVLVLLVIFMLTASAIVRASLQVNLPKAASGGSRVESTVNLVYTKAGDLLLNGEKSSFEAAAAVVRQETAANPKTQAVISADRGVEYGKVIEIVDMVKQNGITAFALDVERTTE